MSMTAHKPPVETKATISLVEVLREMQRAAQGESNVVDLRWRLLEQLVQLFEDETISAFRNATPDNIRHLSVELGRNHWPHWRNAVELAQWAIVQVSQAGRSGTFQEQWIARAEGCHLMLPSLPEDARLHYRATAFLMANAAAGPVGARADTERSRDPQWPWSTPVEQVSECVLAFHALMQGIAIAGIGSARLPAPVVNAIGRELWSRASSDFDEEAVEDAYDLALAAESDVRSEPSLTLDEYLASLQ